MTPWFLQCSISGPLYQTRWNNTLLIKGFATCTLTSIAILSLLLKPFIKYCLLVLQFHHTNLHHSDLPCFKWRSDHELPRPACPWTHLTVLSIELYLFTPLNILETTNAVTRRFKAFIWIRLTQVLAKSYSLWENAIPWVPFVGKGSHKCIFPNILPSKHVKSGNYRPASETPSGWRFAGGPIVALDGMLAW